MSGIWTSAGFFALLLLSLAASAKPGDINRCMDEAGQWVFTDQPCEFAVPNFTPLDAVIADVPHGSCPARTLDQLLLRVRAALATRDFNALSMLFIWNGLGSRSVDARVAMLQGVLKDTLVRVHFERDEPVADAAQDALAVVPKLPPAKGIVAFLTRGSKKDRPGPLIERHFGFYARVGCYWLS